MGFDFGYSFAENEKVKLTIDDKEEFNIDTFAHAAWINTRENPNLEIQIIESMKKGTVWLLKELLKEELILKIHTHCSVSPRHFKR